MKKSLWCVIIKKKSGCEFFAYGSRGVELAIYETKREAKARADEIRPYSEPVVEKCNLAVATKDK